MIEDNVKTQLPAGTKVVANPKFAVDTFVTSEDDPIPGEVVMAVTGTFYLVDFDGEGEEWYPESELTASIFTETALEEAAEKARNGTMADIVAYSALKTRLGR
jgi:hypothetical protein